MSSWYLKIWPFRVSTAVSRVLLSAAASLPSFGGSAQLVCLLAHSWRQLGSVRLALQSSEVRLSSPGVALVAK